MRRLELHCSAQSALANGKVSLPCMSGKAFPKSTRLLGAATFPPSKLFLTSSMGLLRFRLHQTVSTGQKHGKQHQAKNTGLKISATKERSQTTVLDRKSVG